MAGWVTLLCLAAVRTGAELQGEQDKKRHERSKGTYKTKEEVSAVR